VRAGLEKLKRQAEREDGQLLIQTSNNEAAAALSTLPSSQSSDTTRSEESKKEARQMLHCSTKASLARRMEPLYLLPQLLLRPKILKS
jgi:hypothetical protein